MRPNLRHRGTSQHIALGGLLLIIIAGYTLFEARRYLTGPSITLTYPTKDQVVVPRLITLTASTKNIASITVNGRPVYITEDGLLQEPLLLQKGYTILTIVAEDRFGHETKKILELYSIDSNEQSSYEKSGKRS